MSNRLNDVSVPDNSSEPEITLAETICRLSVSKGARDYISEEYQSLYECFLNLGDIYTAKKAHPKAVALYNISLRIARDKLNLSSKIIKEIELRILEAEQQFLKSVLKEKAPILNHVAHQKQIKSYKDHLEQFREATRQALKHAYEEIQKVKNERGPEEAEKKKVELIRAIFKKIATEIKRFVQILLKDCFDILGKPPCGYAIVGLGSLAREEATPYSDFEFAILISEEGKDGKNKEYFRYLTDLLLLKVINLGETIIPAMAIESLNPTNGRNTDFFYDDITPRGFAFDGAMPQACKTPHGKKDVDGRIIFELIQTPDRMAAYHGKTPDGRYWFEVDPHLTTVLSNAIILDGNEQLVQDYQKKLCEILDQPLDPIYSKEFGEKQYSIGKYIAITLMTENSKIFDPNFNLLEKHGALFDAKKDLYRVPNLIIDTLCLYFTIGFFGNNLDKIEKLCNQVLKPESVEKLRWSLTETMRFRLETYLHYKSQKEHMNRLLRYFSLFDHKIIGDLRQNPNKHFLIASDDCDCLCKIYQTIIPLQKATLAFVKGKQDAFLELDINDNDHFIQGYVLARLFQLDKAIVHFKNALGFMKKLHVEKHDQIATIHNNLGSLLLKLGKIKQAIEHYQEAMTIREQLYGRHDPNVAVSYTNLGLAFQAAGDIEKGVEYHLKALQIFNDQFTVNKKVYFGFVESCINAASVFEQRGDFKEAIEYLERALLLSIQHGGFDHPNLVTCYNNLGLVYHSLGLEERAMYYYNQVFELLIKTGSTRIRVGKF